MNQAELDEILQLLNTGDMGRAKERINAQGDVSADYQASLLMGEVLFREGDFARSIACFSRAQQLRKQDYLPSYWLGLAYERIGNMDSAVAAYTASSRKNPTHAKSLQKLKALSTELASDLPSREERREIKGISALTIPQTREDHAEWAKWRLEQQREVVMQDNWTALPRLIRIVMIVGVIGVLAGGSAIAVGWFNSRDDVSSQQEQTCKDLRAGGFSENNLPSFCH